MALGQEEIGRRIAQAREEASLSQRELAEAIGVADAQSISRYERGVTEVKTRRLEKIAEATGKPLGYFVQEIPGELGDAPTPAAPDLREVVEQLQGDVAEILRLLREEPEAGSAQP